MTLRKPTAERRREIADAAITIIGKRGLREFTAARLAQEVGIKDGTIFRHFKDMNAILAAVLDRLHELLEADPRPAEDPLDRLKDFVTNRLHAVAVQPGIQSLLFSDHLAHALGEEGQRRIAALRNQGRQYIRTCLCEASRKGLLRKDIDIEGSVLLITGMVMGFLIAVKDGALSVKIEEMEQRAWQTLLAALLPNQGVS